MLEGKESAWRGGGEVSRKVRAQAVSSEELELFQKVEGRWDLAQGTHGCGRKQPHTVPGLKGGKRP